MKNAILLGAGTLFLILMLALSSLAVAAPTTAGAAAIERGAEAQAPAAAVTPVNPGAMTSRIFIFNPDPTDATVGIQFVDANGATSATIPAFKVVARGATAKTPPPGAINRGSAIISSDRAVQAFVTDSNGKNSARDMFAGMAVTDTQQTLSLPFVRHLAKDTQNSIIAVQNTGDLSSTLTLRLFAPDGTEQLGLPGTSVADVAPLASAYFDTNSIFPAGVFSGTAVVASDNSMPLAAGEQTRFLKDTASFRALGSTSISNTLYVNFTERKTTKSGAPVNWNELYVRNEDAAPATITAEYFTSAGVLVYTSTTAGPISANGMAAFINSTADYAALGKNFKGWVKLTSTAKLSAYSLESWSGKRLFGMEATPSEGFAAKAVCGDIAKSSTQTSRLLILNPDSSQTASVSVILYNSATGKSIGTKKISVGPQKVMTVVASDAVFGTGTSYEGMAVVSSAGPRVLVSVYAPWGTAGGVTSYVCQPLQ